MRFGSVIVRVLLVTAVGACSPEGTGADGASTTPTAPTVPTPVPVATANDLAPSQRIASTVPAPARPVACTLDDIEFWTAQLVANATTIGAVIRLRNTGDVRCDADIGRSPHLDPAIEFDVWLEPDQTADLVVGQEPTECFDPQLVSEIEVAIGDDLAVVPTAVFACAWWLTAFFPNDPVLVACARDDLELAVHPGALLVRNRSTSPCAMAGIVEVEGATTTADPSSGAVVSALMPGDVVAFGRRFASDCVDTRRVGLIDEAAREFVFDDVPCELVFDLGGGRPWFGADAVLPGDLGHASPAVVFETLNPFGATE